MELIEIAQLVTGIATLIVATVLIWQMFIQKRTLEIAHKDADSNMSLSAVQIHAENGKWISENINKSIIEKMSKGSEYLEEDEKLKLEAHIRNVHLVLSTEWRLGRRDRIDTYYKIMYRMYGLMRYKASRDIFKEIIDRQLSSGSFSTKSESKSNPYPVQAKLLVLVKEVYEEFENKKTGD